MDGLRIFPHILVIGVLVPHILVIGVLVIKGRRRPTHTHLTSLTSLAPIASDLTQNELIESDLTQNEFTQSHLIESDLRECHHTKRTHRK